MAEGRETDIVKPLSRLHMEEFPSTQLALPSEGEFGVTIFERDQMSRSPWGGYIEVTRPMVGVEYHPEIVPLINKWLLNRYPGSMFHDGQPLRVTFPVKEPSVEEMLVIERVAAACSIAIGQFDHKAITARLGFSHRIAERLGLDIPIDMDLSYEVQVDELTSYRF